MKMLLLSLLLAAGCAGCTGLASTVKELKDDPAIVTGQINTIYGTAHFTRVGVTHTNSTVTVSPDGTITVKTP